MFKSTWPPWKREESLGKFSTTRTCSHLLIAYAADRMDELQKVRNFVPMPERINPEMKQVVRIQSVDYKKFTKSCAHDRLFLDHLL